ncbi:hypothetical protein Cme02nite_19620 [Catellatospora methionotrophica]|uniref:Uncharacterized protein n=1 Tax=Catellatospora methionotrophica TaxID=121620 RepID=A0A8J3LFS0_9ACTN|nr:hypothetical protein [Catellatospora methionotrophica]GIG13630.1 hypothetical protein Cme02nite_19620 [Catellatospora methionotrophica]
MTVSEQLITASNEERADLRAELITLLDRWQAWRNDPAYPGTGRVGPAWQAGLDRAIAVTRQSVDALPPDHDPSALADLTQPLLSTFWAHRPGPMSEVVTQVALLRLRAVAMHGRVARQLAQELAQQPVGTAAV